MNFRRGLIEYLSGMGCSIIACAPEDDYTDALESIVDEFHPLKLNSYGVNPFSELRLFSGYFQTLRAVRPDICLTYTIKPNVYCSLAASFLSIPCVNNVAGLGQAFVRQNFLTIVAKKLYRISLRKSKKVFFQNDDDMRLFLEGRLVPKNVVERLPGSGICLKAYRPASSELQKTGVLKFSLICRLLKEKGVMEFVAAARIIKQRYTNIEFEIVGFVDNKNRKMVSFEQLEAWDAEGVVSFLGATDDIKEYLATVSCVVLPSFYREGVPRILLEAAAMCIPLITTDAVGCRDAVDDHVNGLLCTPRDVESLVGCIEEMISFSELDRSTMGLRGRDKMESEFDEGIINRKYYKAIKEAVCNDILLVD